jgi:hypothetical protein
MQITDERIYEIASINPTPENIKEMEKRKARREIEKYHDIVIPYGVWDYDLDEYPPGRVYQFYMGDGYIGRLRRNISWSWNGYVVLPNGHHVIGMSYDDVSTLKSKDDRSCPIEITFSKDNIFGFDHCHIYDLKPYEIHKINNNNAKYYTYNMVKEEIGKLAMWFSELV